MAANVGTAPVQFFQGASPVSAYLGATAIARTLYFTGDVDNEWTELGNWSTGSLPTAGDSVIATANISDNSGGAPTVVNLTMATGDGLDINITVTGVATFNGGAQHSATLTGNATFNDSSSNGGTVTGNATFNDFSTNLGTVTGTVTDNT
jgi:hypothetical protein